jgi:hypothetical protein
MFICKTVSSFQFQVSAKPVASSKADENGFAETGNPKLETPFG